MKLPKVNLLLVLSNLALLVAVGYLIKTRSPASARADNPPSPDSTHAPRVIVKGAAPRILTVTNEFLWAQLESESYREYITRLRAIGCPEQTIRDLVIADLDKLLAPRVQAIYGRRQDLKYWQSEEEELANNRDHRDWARQERAMDREKREVIQELLGIDLVRERMKQKGFEDYYERRLGFLPEEKRSSVRQMLEKYDDQEQSLRDQAAEDGAPLTAAEQAQVKQWREQQQEELAKLLTPAEREQYELWLSPTANAVRYSFYGMNATEEEFQTVYKLRKTFDAQWNPETLDLNDSATLQKWDAAKKEMETQIKEALGDQRYLAYQRGDDPDFHSLNATVTQFKLQPEKAADVYEMKRLLMETRNRLLADATLTPEQKEAGAKELAAETARSVKEVLGEKAFNYYQRNGLGAWMQP